MSMSATTVEIAVQDPAGTRIAFAGGADRIELCQALSTGGMTPSFGTLVACAEVAGGAERIAVLVRPRGGGFVYNQEEIDVTSRDIREAVRLGAGGIVIGALTVDRLVDIEALKQWRDAAGDAELVFHRALDVMDQPVDAVETLVELGVQRVLTSGGAARSIDGIDTLAALVQRADGRLQIQAGGGVRVEDIAALRAIGVDAVHLSARATSTDTAPSGPGGGAVGYEVTDPETVQSAVAAAHA